MKQRQPIDIDWLWQQLQRYSPFRRVVVALSGGVDSTVLFHLCVQMRLRQEFPLSVIHINHQLQSDSDSWADHCAELGERWQIPVRIEKVVVEKSAHGLESDAREARYRLFEQQLQQGDILLQGHHADDQAETVIMRLIRGSGVHGLAAIPAQRILGHGRVIRPLLGASRQQILDYALQHNLSWIEDPSNSDRTIERNLIRHEIMPRLEAQRSGVKRALVRSAGQFLESAGLLDQLAEMDLASACPSPSEQPRQLDSDYLSQMERGRCRNLLRYWITLNGFLAPGSTMIDRIIDEGIHSRRDARPLIKWFGAEVRRYRNQLYLMQSRPTDVRHTPLKWQLHNELQLGAGMGLLKAIERTGQGIRATLLKQGEVMVQWREGGERIRPQGHREHHSLKNLFQEAGIPPWQRERYPLIYLDGELICLPNLHNGAEIVATSGELGVVIEWYGSES